MNDNIERLRTKHGDFVYEEYSYNYSGNELKLNYTFKLGDNIVFRPALILRNIDESILKKNDSYNTENFIFNIGMILIPSYWKTTISPRIVIKAAFLTDWQIAYWEDLYIKGMGQFFFENQLDFTQKHFLRVIVDSDRNLRTKPETTSGDRLLVPIGGGKDSVVTLETLKKPNKDLGAFIMKPSSDSAYEVAKTSGIENILEAQVQIDPLLFKMNKEGFLNGHTPYSAQLAFISTFMAILSGYKQIAFSNERSSNEGNISYLGTEINHQYSKTIEFESKFREYNHKVLSDVNYFSFLRPLYELQIAKIFAKLETYHSVIRSCNVGQKQGIWCCNCPKCLSTFILLYPFLGPEKILNIFPHNMYESDNLLTMLKSLVDINVIKPFECVGTREETKIALYLSLTKHTESEMPPLLEYAKNLLLANEREMKNRAINLFTSWDENNFLDNEQNKTLKAVLNEKND